MVNNILFFYALLVSNIKAFNGRYPIGIKLIKKMILTYKYSDTPKGRIQEISIKGYIMIENFSAKPSAGRGGVL